MVKKEIFSQGDFTQLPSRERPEMLNKFVWVLPALPVETNNFVIIFLLPAQWNLPKWYPWQNVHLVNFVHPVAYIPKWFCFHLVASAAVACDHVHFASKFCFKLGLFVCLSHPRFSCNLFPPLCFAIFPAWPWTAQRLHECRQSTSCESLLPYLWHWPF